jgi:hypothetical protein
MSAKERNSCDKHPDCYKFAIAENGRLGIILETIDLKRHTVFIGVPMDCDGNWASLKPRIVSDRIHCRAVADLMRHLSPEDDSPFLPKDMDIKFVKLGSPDSKSQAPGMKDLLSALFGGGPQQPPEVKLDPSDFILGDDEHPDGDQEDGA